jgi:hypothetical protein
VRWPAPEKSPDLGNSSSTPKALMYIELAMDIRSGQARRYRQRGRTGETEKTKAGWLRSGLKAWSNYWTFMMNLENTDLIYELLRKTISKVMRLQGI